MLADQDGDAFVAEQIEERQHDPVPQRENDGKLLLPQLGHYRVIHTAHAPCAAEQTHQLYSASYKMAGLSLAHSTQLVILSACVHRRALDAIIVLPASRCVAGVASSSAMLATRRAAPAVPSDAR